MTKVNMFSGIRIYQSGIQIGEERFVVGNRAAGMVNFSGCHLRCSFCYTPETSVDRLGKDFTDLEWIALLDSLVASGAQNLNLITPTHQWSKIKPGLQTTLQKESNRESLRLVLKITGYEPIRIIDDMAQLASIIVPDFKVWNPDLAVALNLPEDYGLVALKAIQRIDQNLPTEWHFENHQNDSGSVITRGSVVRHLMIPGQIEDSIQIVHELQNIEYRGVVNIMTRYFDPTTRKLRIAPSSEVHQLLERAVGATFEMTVDGKRQKCGVS